MLTETPWILNDCVCCIRKFSLLKKCRQSQIMVLLYISWRFTYIFLLISFANFCLLTGKLSMLTTFCLKTKIRFCRSHFHMMEKLTKIFDFDGEESCSNEDCFLLTAKLSILMRFVYWQRTHFYIFLFFFIWQTSCLFRRFFVCWEKKKTTRIDDLCEWQNSN